MNMTVFLKLVVIKMMLTIFVNYANCSFVNRGRLYGGYEADPESWKFIVSITAGRVHMCIGSIIRPRWIVTAAHCVKGDRYNFLIDLCGDLKVRIGPDKLTYELLQEVLPPEKKSLVDNTTEQMVADEESLKEVDEFFVHPDFYVSNYDKKESQYRIGVVTHDIALITLKEPYDSLVSLPTKSVYYGKFCKSVEWPRPPKQKNEPLMESQMFIVDSERCEAIITLVALKNDLSLENIAILTRNKICGHTYYENTTIFMAGAPLVCDGEIQGIGNIAIIQYTEETKLMTSIFVNIAFYIDWIDGVFRNNSEKPIPFDIFRAKSCHNQFAVVVTSICIFINIVF